MWNFSSTIASTSARRASIAAAMPAAPEPTISTPVVASQWRMSLRLAGVAADRSKLDAVLAAPAEVSASFGRKVRRELLPVALASSVTLDFPPNLHREGR